MWLSYGLQSYFLTSCLEWKSSLLSIRIIILWLRCLGLQRSWYYLLPMLVDKNISLNSLVKWRLLKELLLIVKYLNILFYLFSYSLFRIREHGIGKRVENLLVAKKPSCTARGGSFRSVNMVDCYPILLMLLYGVLLAVSLLVLEKMVHYRGGLRLTANHVVVN